MEKSSQYIPNKHPRHEKTDQIRLALVAVLQFISLFVALFFYNKWYSISVSGASAVVSSLLCGFSQGMLQLIIHRQYNGANLVKYYAWGIINGLWTVCTSLS